MGSAISLTLYLILSRLEYLKTHRDESVLVSANPAFMFHNLILPGQLLRSAVGPLVPLSPNAIMGERSRSISHSFQSREHSDLRFSAAAYGRFGPLIAWRRSSLKAGSIVPVAAISRIRCLRGMVRSRHSQLLRADGRSIIRLRAWCV